MQMKAKLVDSMLPGNWIYEIKFDAALWCGGAAVRRQFSRETKRTGVAICTEAALRNSCDVVER